MRSRVRIACLGAVLMSGTLMGSDAGAQSVPLPAPQPKSFLSLPFIGASTPKDRAAAPAKKPRKVAQVTGATGAPVPPGNIPGGAPVPPGAVPGGTPPAVINAKPGPAPASDPSQRALIDKVNAYLSGLNSLVGNFVQVGPDGSRAEGRFYLQKPGRVRFEYNPPNPIELIADGSSVVVRNSKLATQDVYPLSQTPLRFLVAERIDLMKDTSVVSATADDTFATVVIEEKQTLGGTHRLMLMFGARDFQLRQWTITDPQGYDTTVALYNLDTKQKPDPALFKIDFTRYLQ
jgi:outer membrane lipoprotein-sorting protein